MSRMNFLVFGAGAIGTYIGGSLALAGHRLTFLEQPGTVEALRRQGLLLDLSLEPGGKVFNLPPDERLSFAASLAEALRRAPFDAAIFALKSFDTAAALEGMRAHVAGMPAMLCLSNGVENEDHIAALLGAERVIAGTVTSSVGRTAAGAITLERKRGMGVAASHPLSARLVAALNAAGLNARLYARPLDMKWSKMLTNLPANATAAILDMTAAEVFAQPALFQLEMDLLREALGVMAAMGVRVVNLPGVPVQALAWAAGMPAWMAHPLLKKAVGGGRGAKMPSFHIDLHSGRGRSEVGWLNGAVARFARSHGRRAPVNEMLADTLQALTDGKLPLSAFSRQPEKLLALLAKSNTA